MARSLKTNALTLVATQQSGDRISRRLINVAPNISDEQALSVFAIINSIENDTPTSLTLTRVDTITVGNGTTPGA